jgi:NAD(P)-dependent dehydrogenase (short-subunit alcohol dehydrogenase family)
MTPLLAGKTALIAGGSGAIGSAIAELLAEHGAEVCVHYHRNQELAQEVLGRVKAHGRRCAVRQADLTKVEEAERLVDQTVRELGQLDVLVNCAGIARDNPVQFLSEAEWDQVMQVNLNGPMYTCKAACKHMLPRKSGAIINIASVTGSTGQELRTNYGTSKGALLALTKAMARDLGPHGVRVNAIAPQIVEGGLSTGADPRFVDSTRKMTPVGRLGKAADVAGAALFLASDLSEFLAGEVIFVTGGLITHQM